MQINFTGHHVDVTQPLQDFTTSKLERLERHSAINIQNIRVTFRNENKLRQIVEASVSLPGADLHASSEAEDMYKAVDLLVDKLDKQVIKHKEKLRDHRE